MNGRTTIKGSWWLSIGFGLAGTIALVVTSLMNRHAGVAQAATAEGQQLLGIAAVTVHITGLVLFGMATGELFRAGKWFIGLCTGAVMLAAAVFSVGSIMGFVASERLTIAKARENQEKAAVDRRKAELDAAKERRDTQARLAESAAKWAQGTIRNADGRRERKDAYDAVSKIITAVGQSEPGVPKAPDTSGPEVIMRPDAGSEMISEITGYGIPGIQVSQMVFLSMMMVIIEFFCWPLMAYFRPRREPSPLVIDADYRDVSPTPLRSEPASGLLAPSHALTGEAAVIAAQEAVQNAAARAVPLSLRTPLPGAESALLDIGFPLTGRPARKRDKSQPKDAAERFAVWLRACDLVREALDDEEVTRLYQEFCEADYRMPTSENLLRGELKRLKGVFWSKPRKHGEGEDQGKIKRQARWAIRPGKYLAPAPQSEPPRAVESAPQARQEGRVVSFFRRPLAGAPAREPANDMSTETTDRTAHVDENAKRRQVQSSQRRAAA